MLSDWACGHKGVKTFLKSYSKSCLHSFDLTKIVFYEYEKNQNGSVVSIEWKYFTCRIHIGMSIRKVVALIHYFAGILKEFFHEEKWLNLTNFNSSVFISVLKKGFFSINSI